MPRRPRQKSRTGVYHIIWRGANRQEIFHEKEDWITILRIFRHYKAQCELTVFAWCLMNNHVHLLVKEGNEDISNTMKRIGVSYVKYYNWKYMTTGSLFQGRFRSETVEDSAYLLTVLRYIHQNPVKAGMVTRADEWRWSSCGGYYDKNKSEKDLLDCDFILNMFSYDRTEAIKNFKIFNERENNDECMSAEMHVRRMTDEEAKVKINQMLGEVHIAQVKSLPKFDRDELLRKVKEIERLPLQQAARILGVSVGLMHRA